MMHANPNSATLFGSREVGGGARRIKKNITNKTRKYKKRMSKLSLRRLKKRLRNIGRSRNRSIRGGTYSQFMSNSPNTPSYSLGSLLSSAASGLASPPPFQINTNCTNCIDNYNHYNKMGSSM